MNSLEKEPKTRYGILNIEKRICPRFSINLPVEYFRIDKPVDSLGRVLDNGKGGLLIYFSERIEIGQRLSLKLFFSVESKLDTIELLSEVAWVDMGIGKDDGDYRTGVNIVDISRDDLSKLKKLLINP